MGSCIWSDSYRPWLPPFNPNFHFGLPNLIQYKPKRHPLVCEPHSSSRSRFRPRKTGLSPACKIQNRELASSPHIPQAPTSWSAVLRFVIVLPRHTGPFSEMAVSWPRSNRSPRRPLLVKAARLLVGSGHFGWDCVLAASRLHWGQASIILIAQTMLCLFAMLRLCSAVFLLGLAPFILAQQKSSSMTYHANGTFTVDVHPLTPAPAEGLSRFSIDKQIHGDLDATSKGEMFSGGDPKQGVAGYVAIVESVNLETNSDKFIFDQEIMAQMVALGMRITEVPVPTRYFAQASSASFFQSTIYGFSILLLLGKYLMYRWGWGYHRQFDSLQRRYQSAAQAAGRKS